jgi:hypothetical protein
VYFKRSLVLMTFLSLNLFSLDFDSFLEFTFSNDKQKGPLKIENQSLETLNVEGPLQLINCSIKKLLVQGPLIAKNTEFHTLYVKGSINVDNCLISSIHVSGDLIAINSNFLDTIYAKSSSITLSNSNTQKIIIESSGDNEQVLSLNGKTVINGDIIFLSSNGLVKAESQVVMKGTLEGLK